MNYKSTEEWFKQADYDLETAEELFERRRYMYVIFLSHLALEKALKGLYAKAMGMDAPKTHNLMYLAASIKLEIDAERQGFLQELSDLSIYTRYPYELSQIQKEFKAENTKELLMRSTEALAWLKRQ